MSDKIRIDVAMVNQGFAESREKAQALIMSGVVYVKERKTLKPSERITQKDEIIVRNTKVHPYVSRGGLKLEKALAVFNLNVDGLTALDIGAATGGFTDVLLQNGAKHVTAVDVGYGQLDLKIRKDSRVTVLERTNARYLTTEVIGGIVPDLAVIDVSFISIKLIVPVVAELMQKMGIFCILIKPQFEAGKDKVGKHGVVRDLHTHISVIQDIRNFAQQIGYMMTKLDFSPVKGPAGNIEYLTLFVPFQPNLQCITDSDIEHVVLSSRNRLSCIE